MRSGHTGLCVVELDPCNNAPERPAVLIPSNALHLAFLGKRLTKFVYRPIILGVGL